MSITLWLVVWWQSASISPHPQHTSSNTKHAHTSHTWPHQGMASQVMRRYYSSANSHLMFGHKCTQLIWFCESENVWKMQRKHTIVRIIYTRHIMTLFMNQPSLMHTLCFTVITAQKYLNMRILEARPLRATHGGKQQRCTQLTLIHPNNTLILPNNTLDNTLEHPNM